MRASSRSCSSACSRTAVTSARSGGCGADSRPLPEPVRRKHPIRTSPSTTFAADLTAEAGAVGVSPIGYVIRQRSGDDVEIAEFQTFRVRSLTTSDGVRDHQHPSRDGPPDPRTVRRTWARI